MKIVSVLVLVMAMLVSGAGAVGGGVAASTDLHHRHVGYDWRGEHSRLERDPPQDEHQQRARPWIPRPQLPRQRHCRARRTGCRRQLNYQKEAMSVSSTMGKYAIKWGDLRHFSCYFWK